MIYKEGDIIKDFFICVDKINKKSRYGDLFIDLILKNKSGTIRAKVWQHSTYFLKKFNIGDIVAIKGEVITFRKINEIKVDFINKAENSIYKEYGLTNKDFIWLF